ncbi:MAG TPA: MATE family efflux transporter [Ilumatobacteraceae bacterium]|nr:MATE family efflux transporter [Ilumatobacteraceae bacterium]
MTSTLVSRRQLDRRIISLAIPALGTLAIEPLYVLVDTAIVGRLGTPQLGGMAIASTILLTVISMTASLEYGVTPDVAFAHGAGRSDDARAVATAALRLAVMIGVPMGAVLAVSARPLAWLLGGRGDVLGYAETYLRISCVGLPFILITYVGHGVMRGVNDLRKPLRIVLLANVVNVVFEVIAVYVLDLGIAGSAWSTVVVQVGAALTFIRVLRPHRGSERPTRQLMRKLLRSGVHFAVRSLAMFAVWNTATAVAAHVDTPTLAAHQVLTQLFMFLALMLDALAIPAQSLVAGALGADDTEQALFVGRSSNRLSLWCAAGLAVALAGLSPVLPHIFSSDSAVHSRLTAGLLILALMQFPGAIAFAFDGALIGAHDERWLARQAVINLVGFAPLAIATLAAPRLGLAGLWGAQLAWMTMRAFVNWRRWESRPWQPRSGSRPAIAP